MLNSEIQEETAIYMHIHLCSITKITILRFYHFEIKINLPITRLLWFQNYVPHTETRKPSLFKWVLIKHAMNPHHNILEPSVFGILGAT